MLPSYFKAVSPSLSPKLWFVFVFLSPVWTFTGNVQTYSLRPVTDEKKNGLKYSSVTLLAFSSSNSKWCFNAAHLRVLPARRLC